MIGPLSQTALGSKYIVNIGAQVLLENSAQQQRKGAKLGPAWLGPYIVSRYVGKDLWIWNGKIVKTKANKTLGRARDPRANGAWLSKLTERNMKCLS